MERAFARDSADRFPDTASFSVALRLAASSARAAVDGAGRAPSSEGAEPRAAYPNSASTRAPRPTARIFRARRVPLETAKPVRRNRITRRAAALGFGVALAGGSAGWAIVRTPSVSAQTPSKIVTSRPTCDVRIEAQCVKDWERTSSGIVVSFANQDRVLTYNIGRATDDLRVANFFCGGAETLALYRPETGVVYYWTTWPDNAEGAVVPEVFADQTGIVGARPISGDVTNDGCADLGLDTGSQRVWFSPKTQPDRLAPVSEPSAAT